MQFDEQDSPLLKAQSQSQQQIKLTNLDILSKIPQPIPLYKKQLNDNQTQPKRKISQKLKSQEKKQHRPAYLLSQPDDFQEFNKLPLLYQNGRILHSSIHFNSSFQSGNLSKVAQISKNQYLLKINKDNKKDAFGHWFYFEVTGIRQYTKFNIIPFRKKKSLYENGMKVCIGINNNWSRAGQHISYSFFRNIDQIDYYILSFSIDFSKLSSKANISIAYCFPYTYSKLIKQINELPSNIQKDFLCQSLQGRGIPILRIAYNPSVKKRSIFITGRIHPGQTVGSFAVKGLIKFLISQHPQAKTLRQTFQFHIIPMLNPDGVVNGNYRFSAAGHDLNRKWHKPSQKIHPQIFYAKTYFINLIKTTDVAYVLDFHGHSRRHNYFFYGCSQDNKNIQNYILPYILSKKSFMFSLQNCNYGISRDRQGTLRVALYRLLTQRKKNPIVYTIEASFKGNIGLKNWLPTDYLHIGKQVLKSIQSCLLKKKKQTLIQQIINLDLMKKNSTSDSGSDSNPEFDQQVIVQTDQQPFNFTYRGNIPLSINQSLQVLYNSQRKHNQNLQIKNSSQYFSQIQYSQAQYKKNLSTISTKKPPRITSSLSTARKSVRPKTQNRRTAVIPTVYFGQHGETGKMKCLMLIQNKQKYVQLKNDVVKGDKRGGLLYPKGYNIKRIKMFQSIRKYKK